MNHHPSKIEEAEAQAQTESARALLAHSSELDLPGAPPSNTAPANCIVGETTILRTGVDSLYLSFHGQLDLGVEKKLTELKCLAQSRYIEEQAQAVLELDGHRFEIRPKGYGNFLFVLADGGFFIKASASDAERMPLCHVQVSSELLTRCGIDEPVKALTSIVRQLGLFSMVTVSRVDLCCDFITDRDLATIPIKYWVSRTNFLDPHYENQKYTGTTFGNRKTLRANLYNKLLESRKSQKTYLDDLWWVAGWDRDRAVWRLEFQFPRSVLSQLRINDLSELKSNLNSMWAYAADDWLRLATPSEDQTRSRWANDPLWNVLRQASFGDLPVAPIKRSMLNRVPSDRSLFVNGVSAITSYMAIHNIQGFRAATNEFVLAAEQYHVWNPRRLGFTLNEYGQQQAAKKARLFNLPYGDTKDKTAAAYRKVKGK